MSDAIEAYTIGHEETYDGALAGDAPVIKRGRFVERGISFANGSRPVYKGGIVFRTVEAAADGAKRYGEIHGGSYSVYALALESWDDVYEVEYPEGTWEFLRVDRPVVRKVEVDVVGRTET